MASVKSVKKEEKTVLLLLPEQLHTNFLILESLHIITTMQGSVKKLNHETNELNSAELSNYYHHLPPQLTNLLLRFSKAQIQSEADQIKSSYPLKRDASALKPHIKTELLRRIHLLLESLKPFAKLPAWYHSIKIDKSRVQTAPCVFSAFKPLLQFEVINSKGVLDIKTSVNLNDKTYPLNDFRRYQFLLESKNEYFLLSYKDFQTLEWLRKNDPKQFGHHPEEFSRQVLARLENAYKVNRNGLLAQNEISGIPWNRVLLSELNNAFLVLTPQWIYEGFTVEGPWKNTYEISRNGEAYLIQRHREAESAFVQMLESLHPNFGRQLNGYYYLSFAEAHQNQWFANVYHKLLGLNIQLIGMDMLMHFRYSSHTMAIEATVVKKENDQVVLEMKAFFGKEEVPLTELQKVLLSGQHNVLLQDGSIGVLKDDWVQQYGVVIRHGKITGHEIEVPRWLAFSEEDSTEYAPVLKRVINEKWWKKWQHWQHETADIYPVPAMVQATLRPYQHKGFEWMQLLAEAGAGACLADDMGLGKTLQAICFIAHQLTIHPASRHLIICPASLIYNWQEEFYKIRSFCFLLCILWGRPQPRKPAK